VWGGPNSDDWRKSLAFFLFCDVNFPLDECKYGESSTVALNTEFILSAPKIDNLGLYPNVAKEELLGMLPKLSERKLNS
jgi:hypothetical protein